MYKANNYSRLVKGEIWICYITNQNIFKNIQRYFIANFHNFSIDIIHYKIFAHINSRRFAERFSSIKVLGYGRGFVFA